MFSRRCDARSVNRIREHFSVSVAAFRQAFANRDLRRIQLAHLGSLVGSWNYALALWVYAYNAGGLSAVALLEIVRAVPAALATPFTAALGDRYSRVRVMVTSDLVRVVLMAAVVVVMVATRRSRSCTGSPPRRP